MAFRAQRDGLCTKCNKEIKAGDFISWRRTKSAGVEMLVRKCDKSKSEIRTFTSYPTFVRQGLDGACEISNKKRQSILSRDAWAGGSWDMAKRLASGGDIERAGKLRASILTEARRILSTVPRLDPVYREEGGIWIDVSRYLSGEPEVWGDMVAQGGDRFGKRITLIVEAAVNCHVDADAYERAGTLIGGGVLGLRAAGYTVGLHVAYKIQGGGRTYTTTFPLTGTAGFDAAQLAAVLTPWFFRRIMFAVMETQDADYRREMSIPYGNYGHSVNTMTDEESEIIAGHKGARVIHLNDVLGQGEDAIRQAILPKEVSK